jgi:formylglycine-generating enzyme required for sulfatase activity
VDETRSADRLPDIAAPDASPPKLTRNTGALATDLTPGESRAYPEVSGYEILGILGHGGMGLVYRARQLKANRLVALKMIRAVEHATPHERLRFQIETEAVARLQHPNIVQLHEVGEVRGQPFFSLEFCDGGTLTDRLKKKQPPPREAAELIATLARAMHYAHLRGVVHRDLKPANVLLTADGTAKITDFGLAKRIDEEARDVSKSGAVMGTAQYMAPEQAAGKVRDTGPAADVYGLGALLYECLTGRPPFEGPQHVVLASVLNDEPTSPSRLNPKVPRDLETICLKCLAKEPTRRYPSAEALAEDLGRFLAGEPVQARPVSRLERTVKWARRRPALAALLLVTVLGVAGIVWKYLDAEQQKDIAEAQRKDAVAQKQEAQREAAKAKAVRDFVVNIFQFADPNSKRGTINAREILDEADLRIRRDFADQPELQEDLVTVIEEVYSKIGPVALAPAAMILEARGSVQLHAARGVNQPAVPQLLLFPGDRLQLGADADVQLLVLSDLHKERLNPASTVTVRRKGCEPPEAIREHAVNIPMTFVRLPKGTFSMGWDGNKKGVKTEIKEDFEIAVHTVTQGQWQTVMGSNPSHFSRQGDDKHKVAEISEKELKLFPVESVSWNDVQEFIKKLNEKERGRGWLYRLPTEAEWEYSCRGGATSEEECSHHFYFDKPINDLSSEQANFNGDFPFGKAPKGKDLGRPTRVGAYPPNKLGLCDMHGNVWQWCEDLWEIEGSGRVIRGGCWEDSGSDCRAALRGRGAPTDRSSGVGVRLARVPVR